MFSSRLITWMENHIGRPRKKFYPEKEKVTQNGGRGVIVESSESLAQSDTGISSGSQQVLSSSVTDNKEEYCTTTMESDRSGMTHCLTAVSLPSPESAYSTGYSTDGASPGGTGPPEYYINIRTGKHYFPSPAPTPTSPQPITAFSQVQLADHCMTAPFLKSDSLSCPVTGYSSKFSVHNDETFENRSSIVRRFPTSSSSQKRSEALGSSVRAHEPSAKATQSDGVDIRAKTSLATVPSHFEIFNFSKSPCQKSPQKSQLSTFKLFLKSPKQEKAKAKVDASKAPICESKKKVLSPSKAKKWYKQPFQKFGQKKADPCENSTRSDIKKDVGFDKNVYLLTTASPRQRNRIKTNPWLPTEPMSSQNFQNLKINFSPSLTRNRSCTNTPLRNRKISEVEPIQNQTKRRSTKREDSKEYANVCEKVSGRHMSQKLYLQLSDHSEEDLTLNEMMGTYNESYVYEKETDILSDSDPTDCEDYVSDSEADNGGDERDSHDDELDFIDNGSVVESDDNFVINTGKCTYHDVCLKKNSFLYKSDRHHSRREADLRKSSRKDRDSKGKKTKEDKKRRTFRKSLKYDNDESKRKKEGVMQPKPQFNENGGSLNLNRILIHRIMGNNGSKSADGTPTSIRRQNLLSELRETHIGHVEETNADRKEKCQLRKNVYLMDVEGDKKYSELIEEAENIFQRMQRSPVIQKATDRTFSDLNEDKSQGFADSGKRVESQDVAIRKSPKNLGLNLPVGESSKKLKNFEFEKNKKNSFKAKSSAHSPLDPLGPTFRNFTIFKSTNIDGENTCSGSSDSKVCDLEKLKPKDAVDTHTLVESPIVPISFQSVDLGKPLTSYCPQSEPVKRKIYTCSKTYDKLVKRFENAPQVFEESLNESLRHESLMAKRRSDKEFRCMIKSEKKNYLSVKKNPHDRDFIYNGSCHASLLSPKKTLMPNGVSGLNFTYRHSFDTDVFS